MSETLPSAFLCCTKQTHSLDWSWKADAKVSNTALRTCSLLSQGVRHRSLVLQRGIFFSGSFPGTVNPHQPVYWRYRVPVQLALMLPSGTSEHPPANQPNPWKKTFAGFDKLVEMATRADLVLNSRVSNRPAVCLCSTSTKTNQEKKSNWTSSLAGNKHSKFSIELGSRWLFWYLQMPFK